MPITDSRLKNGTLTINAVSFATQATNVRLVPKVSSTGEPLEVLAGDVIDPDETVDWSLAITAVQDFTDEAGFVNFCLANAGDVHPYSWAPAGAAAGPTYTGTVKVQPVEVGGDVNTRNTTSAEWDCQEAPTTVYPV